MASSSEEEVKKTPQEDEADNRRLRRALSKERHKVARYGDDFEVKPLQGWIQKEAKDPSKPWEKRWMVLEKDPADRPILVYYADDYKHDIKGKILLADIKDIRKNATTHPFCFGVKTDERLYWFSCPDEVSFQKWTISIRAQSGVGLF